MSDGDAPAFAPLTRHDSTQVCIVGAGMAGLSLAYRLACDGRAVVVLEDGEIANGVSARTTGHLTAMLDDRYYELARVHGDEGARLAAASHTAAIDDIEANARAAGVDCDFERVDGYLFAAADRDPDELQREFEAAQAAGLAVEWLPAAPGPFARPAIKLPRQAQLHALKYLYGLARAVVAAGGRIYTNTQVATVAGGAQPFVETAQGLRVQAEHIAVMTNTPVNLRVALHTKQMAYRTYAIACAIPRGDFPRALFWDTGDPYHYVRLQRFDAQRDWLIVGGEDHKTGQADDGDERFKRLESWLKHFVPSAEPPAYRWSGQVMEPVDGLAFIGREPGEERVFVATGDSGNGLTHAAIAARLIGDAVLGRENPWRDLYDPARKRLGTVREYVGENLNTATQYADWLKPAELRSTAELAPGEGGILREGMRKVAAYRDAQGRLHLFSATCPHLGCIVHWNATEKSWDCPCHGSRFDADGRVVNGPANRDLAAHERRRSGRLS